MTDDAQIATGSARQSRSPAGPAALRPRLRFGEFEFAPGQRRLERSGVVVELSSRAVDILDALTERPGEVVTKQDLLARVWPQALVVEAALRVHVAALRRALGDGEAGARFITTIPGRGYCFVGELESSPAAGEPAPAAPTHLVVQRHLPGRPAQVVGRDAVVDDLMRLLELQRFVTIVGPGGIGKTTVALMAAHQWAQAHGGGALFIDLGDLAPENPDAVAEAICARLGLAPQDVDPTQSVIARLRESEALVVLDTCEGVIDAAARLAEGLVASAPGVRVLATSREELRAEGECVSRIEPLATPPADVQLTAQEALLYPAVQLFVQRVSANHAGFELSDPQAPIVGQICRELDGMALAIELAAGRVDAFGVQRVADLLATEFALTWPGRRTATPRQQTLGATLNWSHELLGAAERRVFRRLSVLAGAPFSLEAAMAVCGDDQTPQTEVVEAMFSLVSKSLVRTVTDESRRRYRLLDIARAYARGKLDASGEEADARQRQARFYMGILNSPAAEDHAAAPECVANVRAALTWAFATEGMDALAVELSAATAPLWLREGLMADSRRWTREALARLDRGTTVRSEVETRIALASSLMYSHGITAESHRNWEVAYQNARLEGRSDMRLAGLAVLCVHQLRLARFGAAQRLLDESDFGAVDGDAEFAAGFHWMAAQTAHLLGDHAAASRHAQRVLEELTDAASSLILNLFGYHLEAGALGLLSLSHFFLGDIDNALALRARASASADELHDNPTYWQLDMAYLLDETEEVDRLTTASIESGEPNALRPAVGTGMAFQGLSLARRGELTLGRQTVLRGLSICQDTDFYTHHAFVLAELTLQLTRHGSPIGARAAPTFFFEEPDDETWCTPEVLRIKGEIAELNGDCAEAESRYLDALAMAGRHGALIWRLRAATSLAALRVGQGRAAEAQATLAPVYQRFGASRVWPDLRRAADCLEACHRALEVAAAS